MVIWDYDKTVNVNEMFLSISGEGKWAGQLAFFIRLAGCNLNCSYCDTQHAQDKDCGNEVHINEFDKIITNRRVVLTGGEPLIHKNVDCLIKQLISDNYFIDIETNGSVDLRPFHQIDLKPYQNRRRTMHFTMDWKVPSSGECDKMLISNLKMLDKEDIVKFVVSNIDDLIYIKNELPLSYVKAQVYISPVWGNISLDTIAYFIKVNKLLDWKMQVQLHKLIWGTERKGV